MKIERKLRTVKVFKPKDREKYGKMLKLVHEAMETSKPITEPMPYTLEEFENALVEEDFRQQTGVELTISEKKNIFRTLNKVRKSKSRPELNYDKFQIYLDGIELELAGYLEREFFHSMNIEPQIMLTDDDFVRFNEYYKDKKKIRQHLDDVAIAFGLSRMDDELN